MIHRDIKPGNVLVEAGPALKVKVTDFGLARTADDASLTQSGAITGTPLYMSPEQALGEKLDHRTDLFSLGSVLYAITTGRPAFRAENSLAVLKGVTEQEPRSITEIIPETLAWLSRIIYRLMAKNPAERFQTAAEVAAALAAGPTGVARVVAVPATPTTPRRKHIALVLGLLILGLAVVAGVVVFTRPGGKETSETTNNKGASNPTSQPAEYVDSSAYLPLNPDVPRQVLDFAEIHGATPEQVHKWANDLGPGWVPHVLGDHPSANPPLVHAVAVKPMNAPESRCTLRYIKPGEEIKEPSDDQGKPIGSSGYRLLEKTVLR